MEAIQYLLVSIFLFCDKTNSINLTALDLQKYVESPSFGITSTENNEISTFFPKSRIPTLLRYTFSHNLLLNSNNLKNVKSETDNYTMSKNRLTIDNIPLTVNVRNDLEMIDDVTRCDIRIINIYHGVIYLLVNQWEQLLKPKNNLTSENEPTSLLTMFPRNLGFSKNTMNLINRSMTELMHLQRRGIIRINQLASLYLYSCDLENTFKMDQRKSVEINDVIKTEFNKFIEIYKDYQKMINDDKEEFFQIIEKRINETLNAITEKVKTSFNITVPLIKNLTLIIKTKDPTLIKLQNSSNVKKYPGKTLAEIVQINASINDYPKAIENHLLVLEQVILHMYRFAVNHFELSAKLCEQILDENDMKTIEGFRTYMNFFIPLFVDRFFEFDVSLNQVFVEQILALLDFVFPESDEDFLEDKLTIRNYAKKKKNVEMSLSDYILKFSENTLDALLDLFDVREEKQLWKNENQVIYIEDKELSKTNILNLMNENFITGMKGLIVFIMDFDMGLNIFDEPAKKTNNKKRKNV